jgi:probable F420-dependent oxidoreductase
MRVGSLIPNTGPLPAELGIAAMASAAEAAGAQSLWVSDHLLMIEGTLEGYPYSADGHATWPADIHYYESLTCCSFMAAVTTSCQVGTAVLVLPQRNVLELAKVAATIDRLSGGRLVLGLGAGWYRAEMEALGYGFEDRGRRADQMLATLRDCWSGRPKPIDGHIRVPPGVVLEPTPLQPGGPPLLVGGMTERALRRAARFGDGWLAITWVDRYDVAALARSLDRLRALRAESGDAPLQTTLLLHAADDQADDVPAAIGELAGLGFDQLIVDPPWSAGLDAAAEFIRSARRPQSTCHPPSTSSTDPVT